MRLTTSLLAHTSILLSTLALLPSIAFAKNKDGPTITSTKFENALDNIFYFDDSNVILGQDREAGTVYRSEDAGSTWKPIDHDDQDGHSWDLWPHPFDNKRAYIIGDGATHWMTKDQGKTWKKFTPGSEANYAKQAPLSFHGRDPSKVIWNGLDCVGLSCEEVASYTEDDFHTTEMLGVGTRGCYWAVGTPSFGQDVASVVDDRIFCVKAGQYSPWMKDNRLVVSDDHFEKQELQPALDGDRAVTGIISMAAVKSYLVAAAKSEGTDELALYVSDDSSTWHRAIFGRHRVSEGAYTILESTNYSMQVDVMGSRPVNPMGFLFTSNSNGTFFTRNIDYTNRNTMGRVDFEKVANIQGIVLVNVVTNHEEVEKSTVVDKKVVSQISFDDGRTFQDLEADGKKLHLHSVTDAKQGGRIFSSPAPGIVMGVGNVGASLKAYNDGDLYVSDDAGVTWSLALDGAHLYEFGNNGAVLVAVDDEEPTDFIQYSLDHGKNWKKAKLEKEIRARFLTTVPDSTTLGFLLGGVQESDSDGKTVIYKLDFEGLHERVCSSKDFENWAARVDNNGKASCIMGHKQFFRRRLADADCVINDDFKDPVPKFESCTCTEEDFECDFDFVRDPDDRTKCNPVSPIRAPEGTCKNDGDTFKGPSGWRLIPGNACTRKNGVELDKDVERPCSDTAKQPATSDQIEAEKTKFKAKYFAEWYYLERSETSLGDDETIIMRTDGGEIYMTQDHGKTWKPILEGEPITAIVPNPHEHDAVFFLTRGRTVHYTIDRGETFHTFEAQERPSSLRLPILKFHPDYKDWMLWSGSAGREDQTNVYYTTDRGDHWQTLARYARKCDFIYRKEEDKLIYCEQYEEENPTKNLQLLSSDNWFAKSETKFTNILDYATMAEFIIVAAKTEDQQSLKVDASVNGIEFAEAEFPKNFRVAHQQAYTVLDSSTHAVFLHVTVNNEPDREYGTIIKSNSNGTSYVLTLSAVNRDTSGYVDFEKMLGLEGVAMVNVVSNAAGVDGGDEKRLKSMITHNDGAHWALITPPKLNADGKEYPCVKSGSALEKCALHIHSYTERSDKTATFSSPSAVGIMIAVGNVGEYLVEKTSEETETFITRDAGVTWRPVMKGSYRWEYGDQGSIIVIAPENPRTTKSVHYSLNEGESWTEYEFSDVEMRVDAITTVPSDNSRNFILWGRESGAGADASKIVTVNLDFTGLKSRQRQCKLDEQNPDKDDYELWEPKHPSQQDNCLFGHVAQYHRKKINADCYNGKKITHLHNIARNCTCTREDFECDYNFQMQADGSCELVPGMDPPDHTLNCANNPNQVEFWYPTGYRKIPLSTCQGGRDLEKIESKPCPGHEDEFKRKHGLSGAGLFFAVVIPLAFAGGVWYWVWKTYQERGFGGFGAIRLGESFSSASGSRGSGQNALITIPVAIIAGVVAVAKALPLLATSLFRSIRGYVPLSGGSGGFSGGGPYRSRDSFTNRRGTFADQAYVEDDELLGEDDEVEGEDV